MIARSAHACALAAAIVTMAMVAASQPVARAGSQPAPQRCVVVADLQSDALWRSDASSCATRLAPASTFKIPHAAIALETGVVQPTTVEKWDGTRHPEYPQWDRDHTVVSAMRPSVVWFFQRIAPRIGAARMHGWLTRLRYGNARTDGDVTTYWLNGTLRVSPEEQAVFLRDLYRGRFPIAPAHVQAIRGALEQPGGVAENAAGVIPLEGAWPAGSSWRPKTGRTTFDGRRVSWLVGDATIDGRGYVFAAAVWRDGDAALGPAEAAQLAVNALLERGASKRSR